jgi:cell division protein FtsW (lipid II flippase)
MKKSSITIDREARERNELINQVRAVLRAVVYWVYGTAVITVAVFASYWAYNADLQKNVRIAILTAIAIVAAPVALVIGKIILNGIKSWFKEIR